MKKLLVFAVIAATFASCSNSETKTEEVKTTDSSTTVVTPVVPDSTVKMAPDTTSKMTPDSTKK